MKMKRRWKVMLVLPGLYFLIGLSLAIPYFQHGYEAWIEVYDSVLIMFGGWFLGTITGVLLFSGAIDAEEREKKEWAFRDKVYETYMWNRDSEDHSEENSINHTAIEHDISPSHVRSIVKLYEDE